MTTEKVVGNIMKIVIRRGRTTGLKVKIQADLRSNPLSGFLFNVSTVARKVQFTQPIHAEVSTTMLRTHKIK